MAHGQLKLPVLQNWSCHHCGGCCREHLIAVTPEEKRRIEGQKWSRSDGLCTEEPIVSGPGDGRYYLAHQDDGACVFLDEQGLCRIHARFGEAAKPLACRLYPWAFHPRGSRITASLRFSCPSVVCNLGTSAERRRADLQKLCSEVIAGRNTDIAPPAVHGTETVDWPDYNRFVEALDRSLQDDSVCFTVRLLRTLEWLRVVEQSEFSSVRRDRLDEFLELMQELTRRAQPDNDLPVLRPSRLARILFRQLAGQLARHDTAVLVRAGWTARLQLLKTILRLSAGAGTVPRFPEPASVVAVYGRLPETTVTFRQLEAHAGGRCEPIDALFERYFRVKIQGLHFCGAACADLSLVDGFHTLALMYPVVLWLARWRAACSGRSKLEPEDVQAALATADHNFAYSPALATSGAKNRVRQLAKMGQISALCGWYSL